MAKKRFCPGWQPYTLMLLLMSSLPLIAAQASNAEQEKAWFQSWLAWLQSPSTLRLFAQGVDPRPVMVQAYKDHLAGEGLTATQVEQHWAAIDKQRRGNEESTRLSTNIMYATGYYEGRPPSPFLMDFIRGRRPGKALDCGMGAGRNAVFLASLGWDVTGMDLSDTAIARARLLADKAGVTIHAVRSSYKEFAWGEQQWDLIINVDSWDGGPTAPGWPFTSTFATAPVVQALKPGGLLYLENHGGGSFQPDQLFQAMEKIYSTLKLLKTETGTDPHFDLRTKMPASNQWEWPVGKDVAVLAFQRPSDTQH